MISCERNAANNAPLLSLFSLCSRLRRVRPTESIDLAGWSSSCCTLANVSVHPAPLHEETPRAFSSALESRTRLQSGMQMEMTAGFMQKVLRTFEPPELESTFDELCELEEEADVR